MTPAEKHLVEIRKLDVEYAIDSWKLALKQNAKKIKEIEFTLNTIHEANMKLKENIASKEEELFSLEEQLTR